jgi:hypothetical protein
MIREGYKIFEIDRGEITPVGRLKDGVSAFTEDSLILDSHRTYDKQEDAEQAIKNYLLNIRPEYSTFVVLKVIQL